MNKGYQTLGIAYISKNLNIGQETVIHNVRMNNIKLVLISNDASDNTKKVVTDKCKSYDTPFLIVEDEGNIAKAIGKSNVKVVGIKNRKLADNIYDKLKGE